MEKNKVEEGHSILMAGSLGSPSTDDRTLQAFRTLITSCARTQEHQADHFQVTR